MNSISEAIQKHDEAVKEIRDRMIAQGFKKEFVMNFIKLFEEESN
jgi:hypothetical protein